MANNSKALFWVVLENTGRPICVVEVKTPSTDNLTNVKACGQIFDSMVQIRASYGQCEILGIMTGLEEWRIVWFEDTNVAAQSDECNFNSGLARPSTQELIDRFPVGTSLSASRKLIASPVFSLFEPSLSRLIASALVSGFHAYSRTLPLLSANRVYHTISSDTFMCQIGNELSFAMPAQTSQYFYVLKQCHPGADGRVFLCVTNSMKLCVLKFHYVPQQCEYECHIWNILFGVPEWMFRRSADSQPLVLPFVFHCVEARSEDGKLSVSFDFNLSHWCKEAAFVETEEDRDDFSRLSDIFKIAYGKTKWNVVDVAKLAIAKVAKRKHIHRDIQWRHVSLLPIFNEEEDLRLEPVLIDLARMEAGVEEDIALETMSTRLDEICELLN